MILWAKFFCSLFLIVLLSGCKNSRLWDAVNWPASGFARLEERSSFLLENGYLGRDCGPEDVGGNLLNSPDNALLGDFLSCMELQVGSKVFEDSDEQAVVSLTECSSGGLVGIRMLVEYKGAFHPVKRWCSIAFFEQDEDRDIRAEMSYWRSN